MVQATGHDIQVYHYVEQSAAKHELCTDMHLAFQINNISPQLNSLSHLKNHLHAYMQTRPSIRKFPNIRSKDAVPSSLHISDQRKPPTKLAIIHHQNRIFPPNDITRYALGPRSPSKASRRTKDQQALRGRTNRVMSQSHA